MTMRDVDIVEFLIKDMPVELITSETAYGNHTVAMIFDEVAYLGDVSANVFAAINAYELIFETTLSVEDVDFLANS
jgi:hypothetical protein